MIKYFIVIVLVVGVVLGLAYKPTMKQPRMAQQSPIIGTMTEADAKGAPTTIVDISVTGGVRIGVSPRADANLALVYAVNELYGEIQPFQTSPQDRQRALERVCTTATDCKTYIASHQLDGDVAALFDDCIDVANAFNKYLNTADAIAKGDLTRTQKEQGQTAFSAGYAGGSVAAVVSDNGGSGAEAALVGLAVGTIKYLMEDGERSDARDTAKQAALKSNQDEWLSYLGGINARWIAASKILTGRHGWAESELSMDDLPEEEAALDGLMDGKPGTSASLIMERRIAQRPRDALMLARLDNLKAYDARLTPNQLAELSKQCMVRAALLPADAIFDSARSRIMMLAGDIANTAWARELSGTIWHEEGSQIAAFSIQVWDAALRYDPLDVTGECRERRAWSLLATGQVDNAVTQADEVMPIVGNQPRFAYNYAMAKSAQGDQDTAFKWFKHGVINHGYTIVLRAKDDKNIERMKSAHKEEYLDLVTTKYNWGIRYGVFNDDIYLKNDSAYALTNVTLRCSLAQGSKKWNPELTVESIAPGQEMVWKDCVSIPDSRLDKASAEVTCDQ